MCLKILYDIIAQEMVANVYFLHRRSAAIFGDMTSDKFSVIINKVVSKFSFSWKKDPVVKENKHSKFKPTILGTTVSTTL